MGYQSNRRAGERLPPHRTARSSQTNRDMERLATSNTPLAGGDYMSALLASDSHRHPGMITQHPNATPAMLTFISNENQGPWTPVLAFSGQGSQGGSTPVPAIGYQHYRNPPPLSAASDSGYASRRYFDDMSSLGEAPFDPSVQEMSTRFGTVTVDQPNPREPPPSAYSAPGTGSAPEFHCPICGDYIKTKSALKKHLDRHTKPHVCTEPDCTRTKGFGTQNDLVRHQRSSHKSLSAPGKQYKCTLGQCSVKFKIWPRSDNFRCHLKSVHGVSDENIGNRYYLEGFLYQSVPENDTNLLQGIGGGSVVTGLHSFPATLADDWAMEPWNPGSLGETSMVGGNGQTVAESEEMQLEYMGGATGPSISTPPPNLPPRIQETLDHLSESYRQVSTLRGYEDNDVKFSPQLPPQGPRKTMDSTETASTIAPQHLTYQDLVRQESSGHNLTSRSGEDANPASASNEVSTRQASSRGEHGDASASSSPDNSAASHGSTEMEFGDAMAIEDEDQGEGKHMKTLEGIPKDLIQRYLRENGIVASTTDGASDRDNSEITKQKHSCTWAGCHRGFHRRSELNKHMRRHNKPYGCTFPRCESKFGSKSDWRRHENSQHFQLEMWKCNGQLAGGGACPKACQRRDSFERHLREEHGVDDREEIEARQERCRVDRNSTRFWCGFCMDVVEDTSGSSHGACSERYNHIGNHFTGGNNVEKRSIKEWVNVDPDSGDAKMGDASLGGMDLGERAAEKRKREGSVEYEDVARRAKKVSSGRRV